MIDLYKFIYDENNRSYPYFAEDGHANDLGHFEYYKQIVKPAVERIELWVSIIVKVPGWVYSSMMTAELKVAVPANGTGVI